MRPTFRDDDNGADDRQAAGATATGTTALPEPPPSALAAPTLRGPGGRPGAPTAHTKAHDVRWDLALDWSSGNRHGTIRVDNAGTPFRTSADVNRPGYDYPPGGGEWIKLTDG